MLGEDETFACLELDFSTAHEFGGQQKRCSKSNVQCLPWFTS